MAQDDFQVDSPLPAMPGPTPIPGRRPLADMMADARAMLASSGIPLRGPGAPAAGVDPMSAQMLKDAMAMNQPAPPKEHVWSGTGRALAAGAADLGAQVLGAGEYAANELGGRNNIVARGLNAARTTAQQSANDWRQSMTPEEQDELARQWTTLDPHQTIWQGGPQQLIHSVMLQAAQAAPSTVATLWPVGRLVKAGMTGGALAYVGATQAGLSMGQIANNISDDISNSDENALRQNSPFYAHLVDTGVSPQEARSQLIAKAQASAPIVGGLVTGAISTLAGRFLSPVLSKEGAALSQRLLGGAADQAIQGGSAAGADYLAREAAASTYDKTRSPTLEGFGKQAVEGAATGALQGAAFGAIAGHGPRGQEPIPNNMNPGEVHSTMESTGEPAGSGSGESHTAGPGTPDEYEPVERNREGFETIGTVAPDAQGRYARNGEEYPQYGNPEILTPHSTGQQELDLPQGVAPDQALAIRARHSGDVSHWGDEPETSGYRGAPPPEPQAPPPAQAPGLFEPNGPQGNLDLRGGQMNPPRPAPAPPVAAPAQLNLPLREPARGGRQIPPVVSPPTEYSREDNPQTVADALRARQAQRTTENQPDLFNDQNPRQVMVKDGRVLPGQDPLRAGSLDSPSAEPFGDIQAQLGDLRDAQHERQGVYLSADNIAALRQRGLLDKVRQEAGEDAVPLVNFDRKGGTLIAKNGEVAQRLTQYRDQGAANMQEILGHATGAGAGKPLEGPITVQQRDDRGNVTRESVVGSQAEAEQLAQEYNDVARGRTAHIMSTPAAILRRSQILGLENEHVAGERSMKDARRTVERAADENTTGETANVRARNAAERDLITDEPSAPVSREEAARRMTAEARRIHNEARTRILPGTRVLDPDDLVFPSPDAARKYRELHSELMGAKLMERSTVHPEDAEKGRVGSEIIEKRIATFLKTHPHETEASQVARAAIAVSREGVEKFTGRTGRREVEETTPEINHDKLEPYEMMKLDEAVHPASSVDEPLDRIDTEMFPATRERPTREQIKSMSEDELNHLYDEVLDRSAAASRGTVTADQMRIADDDVRSKMEKRIERFFRTEAANAERMKGKSDKFAASPRRALTARELEKNEAKAGTKKPRLVGYDRLDPEALLHTVESQREMERAASMSPEEQRADQAARLEDLNNAIAYGEKHLSELVKIKREDLPSGESPLIAQKYMRDLLQYGRALRDQSLRAPKARAAAKSFATIIKALGKKAPHARAQYLINTYKTEVQRQAQRATVQDPKAIARVKENVIDPLSNPAEYDAPSGREDPQRALPFARPVQPELGYRGEQIKPFTREQEAELSRLLQKVKDEPKNPAAKRQLNLALGERLNRGLGNLFTTADEQEARWLLDSPIGEEPKTQNLDKESLEYLRSALGYPQKPSRIRDAAAAAGAHLEADDRLPKRINTLLPKIIQKLEPGMPMHKLFTALQRVVDPETIIGYADQSYFKKKNTAAHVSWNDSGPVIYINRDYMDDIRAKGQDPAFELMHAIGHELTHVATSRAIEANPVVRSRLEAILAQARQAEGASEYYGLNSNNVHEMVAEAYSNPKFQKFLDGISVQGAPRSMWQRFKDVVSDILGFRGDNKDHTALDAIMREHGSLFRGKQYATTPGELRRLGLQNLEKDPDGSHVGNGFDRVIKSLKFDKATVKTLQERVSDLKEGAGQFGLSFMTPRQQRAQFGKYFAREDGSNPYERYWDTFFKRAADNAASMEHVGKLSNAWSNLEEKYGIDTANTVSKLMHDATVYGFHPDKPLTHVDNEHLTTPAAQARQRAGAEIFNKLPADWQDHYRRVQKYYATEQRNSTDQMVLNGLHAMLTKGQDAAMTAKEFDSKYDAADVRRLNLDTEEGLQKEFGDKLSGASVRMLSKIGQLNNRPGPYFPLMRNGDYVVTAKRHVGTKEFETSKEAQEYAASQRADDPTLAVKVRATDDGTYTVEVTEKEVRMAETRSQAEQHRRDMATQYGDENTTPVQLKSDLYKQEASITTGSALDTLMRKLEGNPAAQNAIKDFYLRSLGEQSFRKRELSRANRRGVDEANQHRSFAQYGRSQSYWLAQLKYGRHLANAQAEVNKTVLDHRDESKISAVRMGEFARELALRDEISRNPYKVADIVKKGTSITQFLMLTSPSHWFVRAAQPYVLSAPWLGARHGLSDAVGALGRAQRMIADPLLKESANSQLGLKALFSRASAEQSYSVIDQVLSHIKANAGADAKPIADMIQHLRDNNLIDLSMATELSDISKGKSTGLSARVLDASRIMLHLIEVNNRVMTAVAARELGLKSGMTEAQAVEHAAEAITVTHNDYSYGNTPRLFMAQSKGLFGGARPLMFQFMKYPQQVYGMLISSGLAALKGATPAERRVGVKTLLGVLGTHMLAAGAVGATIQPIKWAIGALMAGASAMGYTDQPYTVANALSGDAYDSAMRDVMSELFGTDLGEVLSKGLPAAAGVDLSERMALGSLYSLHLKTDSDSSTIGSLAQAFGGPWLNVGTNFYDAGGKFMKGDVLGAIQNITPHVIRDLVKAGQMSQQGVVNNAGTTLIPADQLSAPQLFAQSLGFRPEQVAETLDRNNAERDTLQNLTDQRKALLQKYAAANPDKRADVRQEMLEFGQKHPGFAIDASSALKAVAAKQLADREMQMYGVRARAKQLAEVTKAGAAYNVGN